MRRRLVLVLVVAPALALGGCGGDDPRGGVADRTVELTTRLSRFEPATITVRAGTTVRFVIRNADPIDHELIVGDDEVHRRHETGTEPFHPPRPGEVTAPAGETVSTTYRFDRPGAVVFACHLPGHFAYGMQGTVHVTA